jgi:hypothetical protein
MGEVVIGVDAHKRSHTLVAVDEVGRRLGVTGRLISTIIPVKRRSSPDGVAGRHGPSAGIFQSSRLEDDAPS